MSNAALFSTAADAYLDILGRIGASQWDDPGRGNWSVRSLAGHAARAILTVESYLAEEEPSDVTIDSAEAYYSSVHPRFTDAAAIEARGVEAGLWLGADPVGQVSAALARTRVLVGGQPTNRIVSIGGMGILLDEYLRTRVFELVIHTIDLSRATRVHHRLPQPAIAAAATLAASVAVVTGNGEQLLLAVTGRQSPPAGFSIM